MAYTPAAQSDANVAAQQYTNEQFLSTIFGLPEVTGTMGAVTFSGDVRTPGYDPKSRKTPAVSINDALAQLHELPKDQMISWKNKLYDAGLYDPAMYSKGLKPRQIGVMTAEDTEAFRSLLLTSARAPSGSTTQQVLEALGQDGDGGSPYSAKNNYGRQPYQSTATASDPATIQKYAQTAAQELLGRDLTPDEESRLVSRLQSAERTGITNSAQAAADLQASGQGGVVVNEGVDVNARAEAELEASHAAEAEAKKFANGYDILMKMIGAGS